MPVTSRDVNVPTLVIFGWAFEYTVLEIKALPTWPLTFAPATLFAVVAYVARLAVLAILAMLIMLTLQVQQ